MDISNYQLIQWVKRIVTPGSLQNMDDLIKEDMKNYMKGYLTPNQIVNYEFFDGWGG